MMKFLNLYKIKYYKFNSSINDWVNSIYTYYNYNINTYFTSKKLNNLLNIYFNFNNISDRYTLKRIFIGVSDIKHSIDSIIINIYVFNKEKLYFLKKIKKLKKNKQLNYFYKIRVSNIKIYKFNDMFLYNSLKINLRKELYFSFLYKYYISKLFINNFKFNVINLNNLNNILSKFYKKKINLNIISMKYLHLDNSLFIDAITRKLRDRNRKVLRVLRKALSLSKIPKIHPLLLLKGKKHINLIQNISYKNILKNKNIKLNIFELMKNTHIMGIWLEGKGRLTKRLTASRSVYKITHKGTLNNIYSSVQGYSSMISKGLYSSSIDYKTINSYNRNGAYGIKSYNNTF